MNISDKLKTLKSTDLNCNVFDVYSYDGLSMQELLCQFFTKINECIKVSNETIDLTTWLVNEGLKIEVVNKLMLWLNDGTLENLINVNLFNTLHSKIENINTQLSHNENELFNNINVVDNMRMSNLKKNYNGPIVTFIDDDATSKVITRWKTLADSKGINIDYGVITSKVGTSGYLSLDDLKMLYKNGNGILSHSVNHLNANSLTNEQIHNECKNSLKWCRDNGFNEIYNCFVSPFGIDFNNVSSINYKNIIRQYYDYAFATGDIHNDSIIDSYAIKRFVCDTKSVEQMKAYVDYAFENNLWLVLMTHCGDDRYYNDTKMNEIGQVIDYIKSKSIPILKSSLALEYKGNDIFTGDYFENNKVIISKNSEVSNLHKITGEFSEIDKHINTYKNNTVTTLKIMGGSHDNITGQGGTMTVYRIDDYYSYAVYVSTGGVSGGQLQDACKMYIRHWVGNQNQGSWGAWKQVTLT